MIFKRQDYQQECIALLKNFDFNTQNMMDTNRNLYC